MDTEMFGQLLEMVGQAGQGGFILALLWVLKGYFVGLLVVSVVIGALIVFYKLVQSNFLPSVVAALGFDFTFPLASYERRQILDRISSLKNKSNGK